MIEAIDKVLHDGLLYKQNLPVLYYILLKSFLLDRTRVNGDRFDLYVTQSIIPQGSPLGIPGPRYI